MGRMFLGEADKNSQTSQREKEQFPKESPLDKQKSRSAAIVCRGGD